MSVQLCIEWYGLPHRNNDICTCHLMSHSEDPVFKNTNVRVIGISPDSVTKQKKFVDKNHLTVCDLKFCGLAEAEVCMSSVFHFKRREGRSSAIVLCHPRADGFDDVE